MVRIQPMVLALGPILQARGGEAPCVAGLDPHSSTVTIGGG